MVKTDQSANPLFQNNFGTNRVTKQFFSPKYSAFVTYTSKFDDPITAKDSVFSRKRAVSKNSISESYKSRIMSDEFWNNTDVDSSADMKPKELSNRPVAYPSQKNPYKLTDGNHSKHGFFETITTKFYNWIYPQDSLPIVSANTPKPSIDRPDSNNVASFKRRDTSCDTETQIQLKKSRKLTNNDRPATKRGNLVLKDTTKTNPVDQHSLKAKLNFNPCTKTSTRSKENSFDWKHTQQDVTDTKEPYGSAFFINRKRPQPQNDYYNSENEFTYLREFVLGSGTDSTVESEKTKQIKLMQKDSVNEQSSVKYSLTKLIASIKKELYTEKSAKLFDDVVFVDEIKTYRPLEITPREKLVFRRSFFDQEFKAYKEILAEREALRKSLQEAKKQKLIPALSQTDLRSVNDIFENKFHGQDPISKTYQLEINQRDFKTLAPGRWLNDTIIEFYMKHIEANTEKTVSFNSFFFTALSERGYAGVRRWMKRKKVNSISELHKVFVPINLNQSHWVLGLIDMQKKKIFYVDSLSSPSSSNKQAFSIMKILKNYVIEESGNTIGMDFDMEQLHCPQQPNGFDCGIFVFMNSLYLSKDMALNFSPSESKNMRRYVGKLILEKNGVK